MGLTTPGQTRSKRRRYLRALRTVLAPVSTLKKGVVQGSRDGCFTPVSFSSSSNRKRERCKLNRPFFAVDQEQVCVCSYTKKKKKTAPILMSTKDWGRESLPVKKKEKDKVHSISPLSLPLLVSHSCVRIPNLFE